MDVNIFSVKLNKLYLFMWVLSVSNVDTQALLGIASFCSLMLSIEWFCSLVTHCLHPGTCGDTNVVTTAAECTHAVSNLDFATSRMHVTSASGKNASMPAGCLVVLEWLPGDTSGPHGITAYFNELQTSEVACGDMSVAADLFGAEYKQALGNEVGVELFFRNGTHLEITLAGPVNVWYGIGLNASEMTGTYAVVVDGDKGKSFSMQHT